MGPSFLTILFLLLAVWYGYRITRDTIPKPTTTLNTTYDYVIVGAGAAGSVLANRLTEDPDVNVLVLEAGNEEHEPMYDIPWNAPRAQMTPADWMYYSVPQKHACYGMNENRQYIPRGRGLGGSTLVNGLVFIRGNRYDFDTWAADGCDGWSYKDVLPYFKKLENVEIDDLKTSEYRSQGGPMTVSDTAISKITAEFLKSGEELGHKVVDCNGIGGEQRGFCRMQAIVGNSIRWHTARGYLWPAMTRSNLHVATQAHVQKVIMDGKKAVGVEVIVNGRKKAFYVNREVILSAGTIATPQILMLSGIGPKQHLSELKIPVVADLPVGIGLQDHVMFFLKAKINDTISVTNEKVESWRTWIQYHLFGTGYLSTNAAVEGTAWLCTDPDHQTHSYRCPDVQYIFFSSLAEHGDAYDHFNYKREIGDEIYGKVHDNEGFTVAIETTHPKSRGNIRLQSRDPFDYPLIDVRYFEDPYDIKPIIRGIRHFQKLLKTNTMKHLDAKMYGKPLTPCSGHDYDSDRYWECVVRHLSVSGYHQTSTCRMGRASDATTVVDTSLRVHGLQNIRVIDASVFPGVTSGNTMASTIMIAEKAADIIRGL